MGGGSGVREPVLEAKAREQGGGFLSSRPSDTGLLPPLRPSPRSAPRPWDSKPYRHLDSVRIRSGEAESRKRSVSGELAWVEWAEVSRKRRAKRINALPVPASAVCYRCADSKGHQGARQH